MLGPLGKSSFCGILKFSEPLAGTMQRYVGLTRYYTKHTEQKSQLTGVTKTDSQDKLQRIISKSKTLSKLSKNPRFARYFDRLHEAGVTSTVTSFLILHELSAIAPLFTLWWVFYQIDLPDQYELPLYFTNLLNQCGDAMEKLVGENYSEGFDRNRLILSGAISYAIVKFLYPLRVLVSLWGAPYLGQWLLLPFYKVTSLFNKNKKGKIPKK